MNKWNAYNSGEIVAQAKADCGCPEEKFLKCAETFAQAKKVDDLAHPAVGQFSRWVIQKTAREIANKMGCRRDSR